MSLTHTNAPARDQRIAIAAPTPLPPPVTSAVRPRDQISTSPGHRPSDFHDDRDDDRAAARALVDEPAERLAARGGAASRSRSRPRLAASAIDARTACFASSRRSSASGAYTQPRVTISGPVTISPVCGVDGDDHDDDALLGERAPVAQHAVADVADDAVDVHVAGGHRAPFDVERRRASSVTTSPSSQTSTWSSAHADLACELARGARGGGTRRAPGTNHSGASRLSMNFSSSCDA